jgi:2'-5' RNA ligase
MRLFVALEVNEAVRAGCAALQAELQKTDRKVSWPPPGNLHVTVKFLGEVGEPTAGEVERALGEAAATATGFTLSFRGAGAFPGLSRPRVLVVEAESVPPALARLHGEIEERMWGLGFARERRAFRPHLTLGRVRGRGPGRPWPELAELADAPVGETRVDELALVCSTLTPQGAVYDVVARAPLGGDEEGK